MSPAARHENPRVSVSMVAYNQVKWVGEAIQSVLDQDFDDFEVVVGDDCSTDGTRDVAEGYARRDSRVRLLPAQANLGGRKNYIRTLSACRGEFINQLDGDDYFIDRSKLRLQVQLLDAHPDLVGCFAASQEVSEDGVALGEAKHIRPLKERYSIADFAGYCMSDSAAMIFRRGLFGDFPDWFRQASQGDWPLHMLNAQYGDFGYINTAMSAYRIHGAGVWNKKTEVQRVAGNLACQLAFLTHLPPQLVDRIRPQIVRHLFRQQKHLLERGKVEAAQLVMDWMDEHVRRDMPVLRSLKARIRLGMAKRKAGPVQSTPR